MNAPNPFDTINPVKDEIVRILKSESVDRSDEKARDQVSQLHASKINNVFQREGIEATCSMVIIWRDNIEARLKVNGDLLSVWDNDPK